MTKARLLTDVDSNQVWLNPTHVVSIGDNEDKPGTCIVTRSVGKPLFINETAEDAVTLLWEPREDEVDLSYLNAL